jgi:hypothetical protein
MVMVALKVVSAVANELRDNTSITNENERVDRNMGSPVRNSLSLRAGLWCFFTWCFYCADFHWLKIEFA